MTLGEYKIYRSFTTVLFLLALTIGLASKSIAETTLKEPSKAQKDHQNANGEYVRKRFLQLMKKPFDTANNNQMKILIIGDSHAQDFLNAIAENKLLTNSQIRTRYIPTRCQIYLGDNSKRKIDKSDAALCKKSDSLKQAKKQITEADIIIFSALWRKWATKALPETIANLELSAEQKIFVIGRRSFLKADNQAMLDIPKNRRHVLRNEVDIHQLAINALMTKKLDQRIFVDVHTLVCGSASTCPVYTDRLKMISFDGGHLSQDGARYLGDILFKKSQLSELINVN